MTRRLLILLLILMPLNVLAQTDMLKVSLHNGTTNYFSLGDSIKLTPQGDSIIVCSKHITLGYSKKNFWKYRFMNVSEIVGIETTLLPSSDISVIRQGDDIIIKGICSDSRLKVYHSNGTECSPSVDYYSGQETSDVTVHLGSLPTGVYIIIASNCPKLPTMKFVRY